MTERTTEPFIQPISSQILIDQVIAFQILGPPSNIDVRGTLQKCLEFLGDAVVCQWFVRGSSGRLMILITVGYDGPPNCVTAITLAVDPKASILPAMSTRNVLGSLWVECASPYLFF